MFIILGPIWRLTHQRNEGEWLYSYLACFDGIAIGCCTALLVGKVSLSGLTAKTLEVAVVIGMADLYFAKPIAETNILGVSLMAAGTGCLLLGTGFRQAGSVATLNVAAGVVCWFGQFSYELYLFHLVVLGGMRIVWPVRAVAGDTRVSDDSSSVRRP